MLSRPVLSTILAGSLTLTLVGCSSVFPAPEGPTGLAAEVASKAEEVALQIGGTNGFGGSYMTAYYNHMGPHMGFHNEFYLADPDDDSIVELTNESQFPCVFHVAYLQSDLGLDQQVETVAVEAGETVEVNLPCAEIIGIGSLTDVGAVAAELPDGTSLDNRFCVPGFLNSDYACGGTYTCLLTPDADDLDQDGDTDELIVITTGMQTHMQQGGMGSHMWDDGYPYGGMMGGWSPMMGYRSGGY